MLRQAWKEKIKPCLVLNKIDRLYTELHLTPNEAFHRISQVLEQVNSITGTLFSEEWFKRQVRGDVENSNKRVIG